MLSCLYCKCLHVNIYLTFYFQQLLHYIYKEGQIDPMCVIEADDVTLVPKLLKNLKKGNWRTLDEIVSSPIIALAAIRVSYIIYYIWEVIKISTLNIYILLCIDITGLKKFCIIFFSQSFSLLGTEYHHCIFFLICGVYYF